MNDSWYDTAQICTNGHIITTQLVYNPDHSMNYCDRCGAPTITNCQNCNANIRGFYHAGASISGSDISKIPIFCPDCGKSYPWTELKLKAAQELADELDNLSQEERELLKKSLDDIIRETPQTTVAATRLKRFLTKAGPVAAEGFKRILLDLISETAKKAIWGV